MKNREIMIEKLPTNGVITSLLMFCVVTLLWGCRKDLFDHDQTGTKIYIQLDWAEAHTKPKTVDVRFFEQLEVKGDEQTPQTRAVVFDRLLNPDGGYITLSDKPYSALIYSSDYNDEDATLYRGVERYETLEAYTATKSRSSFTKAVPNEPTVSEPDYLYCHNISDYKIDTTASMTILAKPKSMVYTYEFNTKVKGLEYVVSARGAITGMSSSVFLSTGKISEKAVTILFPGNETDFTNFKFRSFGPINNPDVEHIITLEFLKKDGTTEQHILEPQTEQLNEMPKGGLIIIPEDEVIIIQPTSNGSSFDGEVKDWDGIDVILPTI